MRNSSCHPGFAAGEVFTGNGNPGQIIRINRPTGTVRDQSMGGSGRGFGETAVIRGSLFQDRFCAAAAT